VRRDCPRTVRETYRDNCVIRLGFAGKLDLTRIPGGRCYARGVRTGDARLKKGRTVARKPRTCDGSAGGSSAATRPGGTDMATATTRCPPARRPSKLRLSRPADHRGSSSCLGHRGLLEPKYSGVQETGATSVGTLSDSQLNSESDDQAKRLGSSNGTPIRLSRIDDLQRHIASPLRHNA